MGFAGTSKGSFFEAPEWVDIKKMPGYTSQKKVYPPNYFNSILSLEFFLWSPNLVWFCIAVLDYIFFPYDFVSAKVWAMDWITFRLLINLGIYFSYCGFWHLSLYWWNWAKRPFNSVRVWRWGKFLHNVWYSFLGILQWTIWESVFIYCYATNRLPYMKDKEIFMTVKNGLWFIFGCLVIPLYRSIHFYLAHRLIHIGPLYRFIHSLHHRNTDIEPFAGLSMHPIEHLFYYSCLCFSLYIWGSPFFFMWNGVHLSISPSASHSGFEDHFQSDQFHYLHHRFFECNYGTGDIPFDYIFGTFRDKMNIDGSSYKGDADIVTDDAAKILDSKANIFSRPSKETLIYYILVIPLYILVVQKVLIINPVFIENASLIAFLASMGPILIGILISFFSSNKKDLRRLLFYPFHKESFFGSFGINILLSILVTVIPTFHTIQMLCSEPGEGIYFILNKK